MALSHQRESQAAVEGQVAAETGQQSGPLPGDDDWDEERLINAMKTLKEIHIQAGISLPLACFL